MVGKQAHAGLHQVPLSVDLQQFPSPRNDLASKLSPPNMALDGTHFVASCGLYSVLLKVAMVLASGK